MLTRPDDDRRSERALSIGKHGLDQRLTHFSGRPDDGMRTARSMLSAPAALIS
jgi:hypothetical protein